MISNHVHNFDAPINTCALFQDYSIYINTRNFENRVYGPLVNMFGAIPTPMGIEQTKLFIHEVTKS